MIHVGIAIDDIYSNKARLMMIVIGVPILCARENTRPYMMTVRAGNDNSMISSYDTSNGYYQPELWLET